MKVLLIALLLPVLSAGQTIHFEKKDILYKGNVKTAGTTATDLSANLSNAVQIAAKETKAKIDQQAGGQMLVAQGMVRMNAPFRIIRNVHFTLTLHPQGSGYDYRIDSVYITEKRRAGRETTRSSKELLEGIEDTGLKAIETERLLNEIDMRLQKVLAIIKRQMTNNQTR